MHDPDTQAFVIPYRWKTEIFKDGSKWRYWSPLITIWHHDPEKRGDDDSCGWSRPHLSQKAREIVKALAGDEARDPWFFALDAKTNDDPILCERLLFGAFMLISRCFKNRGILRRAVTVEEAQRWAAELTYNAVDNFRGTLCFRSGYHSNWYKGDEGIPNTPEQDEHWRQDQAERFFSAIGRYILRERRWWFQHPKWHFWHWRFQIHLLQTFKRWAFSRCCKCGGRFTWGYSPLTYSWSGNGPRWFKSEPNVLHSYCDKPREPLADPARLNSPEAE